MNHSPAEGSESQLKDAERMPSPGISPEDARWWRRALGLALFTVVYNVAEGVAATWFGIKDDALTLFGFGADSSIEVVSAIGILHLLWRLRRYGHAERDRFERTALRITGFCFYLLVVFLVAGAVYKFATGEKPGTAVPGLVISGISMAFMGFLIAAKTRVGRALDSAPILADAACSKVCLWMSLVLLLSSGVYAATGFAWTDSLGALALAWFSFREGRECFGKAKGRAACSCEGGGCGTGDSSD